MLSVLYAECHYAECHFAECRGAWFISCPSKGCIYRNINFPSKEKGKKSYRTDVVLDHKSKYGLKQFHSLVS